MNSWKYLFTKSILEKADKFKGKIDDIEHTPTSIKAVVKSTREFNVELLLEEDLFLDVSCSCSAKSHCVHEAIFLKFIDEYHEIVDDHKSYHNKKNSLLNEDTENILKNISKTKLNSFIKKEFKQNPKFKYDFIKYFNKTSLIDKKAYEKKLKRIFNNAKGPGFSYDGYYDMRSLAKPLKQFMREDIKRLVNLKEYEFACKLLNDIMDELDNEIYLDDKSFDNAIYYYQDYADILLEEKLSQKNRNKMQKHLGRFNFFGF